MAKETTYRVEEPAFLLDFLLAHINGQSRNSVKHLLSRGQVLVDGVPRTRFDHPLRPGAQVTLLPASKGTSLPFPVLYEDDGLLVINKPAGLLSVSTEDRHQRTAYRLLADNLRGREPRSRLFVVHRLDRDTSGVLLFAKNQELKQALQENWNDLVSRREYLAVVEGDGLPDAGLFRSLLTENRIHRVYSTRGKTGKEALTRYTVLERRKGYTLLNVSIDTGRKNQIRVHLSESGHPVAGDEKYGAATDPMGRLALHAHRLALTDPKAGTSFTFTAPVPDGFRRMFPKQLG